MELELNLLQKPIRMLSQKKKLCSRPLKTKLLIQMRQLSRTRKMSNPLQKKSKKTIVQTTFMPKILKTRES